MRPDPIDAALIIAYRRYENVEKLLEILSQQGFKRIYIAIDHHSPSNPSSLVEVHRTVEIAMNARSVMSELIHVAVHSENVGCSAAVLSACDWFFDYEEFGVIFEDDCIPTKEFFTFANHSKQIVEKNIGVWLFCGTQFASSRTSQDSWSLSKYALIWGWGTSREKWSHISTALKVGIKGIQAKNVGLAERQYWKAGARRSTSGIVDAWDNVLIQNMLRHGRRAVLPEFALVSNIGNDSAATHTIGKSSWLHIKTGGFRIPHEEPKENPIMDSWLKNEFYGISIRHIVTTRITQILDLITMRNRRAENLNARWEKARKNLVEFR